MWEKKYFQSEKPNKAFALLQLIFVLVIIGVIVYFISGVGNRVQTGTKKVVSTSQDLKRLTDFSALTKALEFYQTFEEHFPIWSEGGCLGEKGNPLESALVPSYLGRLPEDPLFPSQCYFYKSTLDGSAFWLATKLEDKEKSKSDGGIFPDYYELFSDEKRIAGIIMDLKEIEKAVKRVSP